MIVLNHFLRRLIRLGSLIVIGPDGSHHRFQGQLVANLRPCTVRLHDRRLLWSIPLNPSVAIGEAYMDGRLTLEQGSLYDFLALASANAQLFGDRISPIDMIDIWTRRFQQWNPASRSRRNVAHHYDLSDRLYDLFLDSDRLYSCAYFPQPRMTLDQAQAAKKRHIIDKLLLEPGHRVLDIGCGWGGLALEIARRAAVNVLGVTLSEHQLRIARKRAEAAGLADRVRFELIDYRQVQGHFDRIVSVGMFEHVGIGHYGEFFAKVYGLMPAHGIALLHSIGRNGRPSSTDSWIRKYIFPGGYCPSLSEVFPPVEASGLFTTDLEILRPSHYADTLRQWRERFVAQWPTARSLYDERFCRMWEFYLAGCEAAFRHRNLMVFQIQLARTPHAVPATRNYMADQSFPINGLAAAQ
jgi:cyclopropane-fatty-acyl-phospholipid synthase